MFKIAFSPIIAIGIQKEYQESFFLKKKKKNICPYCKKECHGLCLETEIKSKNFEEN